MNFKYFLFFFVFLSFSIISAQDSTDTNVQNDNHWKKHKWKWDWNWDWDFDFYSNVDRRPMIEVNYGLGNPNHKKFIGDFSKVGLIEFKIGYSRLNSKCDDEENGYINELDDKYLFFSKLSTNLLSDKSSIDGLTSDMIRFGFGRREGYGYSTSFISIIPYHSDAFLWSKLNDFDKSIITTPNDFKIVNRYLDNFRFSTLAEGGVKLEIAKTISFDASYEAAVIFPRYLFWKHLGSLAIEAAGYGLIDNFVDKIFERSSPAAPIVNFILKNGYSYGFYLLKKENMNWPFKTETPLTYESFKFGVTFLF